MGKFQKLDVISGTKVVQFWSYQKMLITKNVLLNWYSSMKKKNEKDSDNFWYRKLTLKVERLGDLALFDTSPLTQFSKFNNFLWVCWFLGKNLSNFVPPVWKVHNPYCHTYHSITKPVFWNTKSSLGFALEINRLIARFEYWIPDIGCGITMFRTDFRRHIYDKKWIIISSRRVWFTQFSTKVWILKKVSNQLLKTDRKWKLLRNDRFMPLCDHLFAIYFSQN